MKIKLSIAMASNPRTRPILENKVSPDGIDLVPTVLHASEMFWRQLKFAEFDISEMSFSSLMMANAAGDDRWVGLPVFTTRRFFHTGILVRRDAGINSPEDLKGKRVGVPEFQQTAALWTRGILEHEFGVRTSDMEYWMERVPSHSHAAATGFKAPRGVTIHQIPAEKNIGTMMLSGELQATLHYIVNANLVDRSVADLWRHPDIKPLFPDQLGEGVRYFKKTNIFPINHGMVIRREVVERYPWVVLNLLKAFNEANDLAAKDRLAQTEYHVATGLLPREAEKALKQPLGLHGIVANRLVLETAAQMSHEQGLTDRLVKLEDVFAENTLQQ